MSVSIPLKDMTYEEKIQAMETIWDGFSQQEEQDQSPQWHSKVLAERKKAVADGSEEFIDWEVAKENIRKSI